MLSNQGIYIVPQLEDQGRITEQISLQFYRL